MRSTRDQKLLAVSIIVLALLLLTPLARIAVGAALLGVVALLMIRFIRVPAVTTGVDAGRTARPHIALAAAGCELTERWRPRRSRRCQCLPRGP